MTAETEIARHYASEELIERIKSGLIAAGVDLENAQPRDINAVDEFHIGGSEATTALIDKLDLTDATEILDIGSGIGGTARFVAGRTGATVTGIDLTMEFVETAENLSALVGMSNQTRFRKASALAMPFPDNSFDAAFMLHVGMNIPDKSRLMAETMRVLRPGAVFGIYDVMKTGDDELVFPVPWSTTAETSFVASRETYLMAAQEAGFEIVTQRDRRDFALDFFVRLAAKAKSAKPTPLG
ncbi:MAG: methyltransferase domain-containing protein, partial [Fimbriimonadaceae bacterium]|nr:methyltransferase domain-containing protein [Alphaproteobacteria bacterium]